MFLRDRFRTIESAVPADSNILNQSVVECFYFQNVTCSNTLLLLMSLTFAVGRTIKPILTNGIFHKGCFNIVRLGSLYIWRGHELYILTDVVFLSF